MQDNNSDPSKEEEKITGYMKELGLE